MKGLAEALAKEATQGMREFLQEKRAEHNREYQMNSQTKELRRVTRGTYKDRTVRLMGPVEGVPGFWKCALPVLKRRGGKLVESDESTEVMLAEGQLQPLD